MNGKMSTSNNSSVSTLTSHSVTSINDEMCSLKTQYMRRSIIQICLKLKQEIFILQVMRWIHRTKILANKTWNSVILEYLLKYKSMK